MFDRVALLICDRATFHEQNRWVDEPKQLCFFCGRETRCHIPTRAGDNPPQPGERYVQRSVLQIAVENIPKVSWKKYPFPREWDAASLFWRRHAVGRERSSRSPSTSAMARMTSVDAC